MPVSAKNTDLDARTQIRSVLDVAAQPFLESADAAAPERLALGEALERFIDPERRKQWDAAIGAAAASLELEPCPIIAVLGELNAGKSSVVATFLGPEGRRRLPRGEEDAAGTHRFVYWVPQKWLDHTNTREALLHLLAAAHGPGHEDLSHDWGVAAEQYRSGREHPERLGIPLVAGDAGLNTLGAAFLDCPDVQTRDAPPAAGSGGDDNARLQFVGLAARLCSAFWVVWRRSQVRDRLFHTMLETVRRRMSGARLCLLLNMIKPAEGQPTKTRRDRDVEQAMHDFAIDAADVYGAFDYDSVGWRELTPPALVERFDAEQTADAAARFPQFFQIAGDDGANAPHAVAPERFLQSLPPRLDPADLQEQLLADHLVELKRVGHEAVAAVDTALDRRRAATLAAVVGLFELCRGQFVDVGGRPKQIASREFNAALDASFRRTAPWTAKAPLALKEAAWSAGRAGKRLVGRWLPLAGAGRWVGDVLKVRGDAKAGGLQLVDADKLADEMVRERWVPAETPRAEIVAAWRTVLDQLGRWQPPIRDADLDAMTEKFWTDLRTQHPVRLALGSVLSLLGVLGVITAAVDGGATLLASYSLAGSLAAHLPGVAALGAAGLGAGGAALAGAQLDALHLNTLPYLRAFFAMSCDAFRLPRDVAGQPLAARFGPPGAEQLYSLPEVEVPRLAEVCPLGDHRSWRHAPSASDYRKVFADV